MWLGWAPGTLCLCLVRGDTVRMGGAPDAMQLRREWRICLLISLLKVAQHHGRKPPRALLQALSVSADGRQPCLGSPTSDGCFQNLNPEGFPRLCTRCDSMRAC